MVPSNGTDDHLWPKEYVSRLPTARACLVLDQSFIYWFCDEVGCVMSELIDSNKEHWKLWSQKFQKQIWKGNILLKKHGNTPYIHVLYLLFCPSEPWSDFAAGQPNNYDGNQACAALVTQHTPDKLGDEAATNYSRTSATT